MIFSIPRPKSCQIERHDLPDPVVRDQIVAVPEDIADAGDVLPRNVRMIGLCLCWLCGARLRRGFRDGVLSLHGPAHRSYRWSFSCPSNRTGLLICPPDHNAKLRRCRGRQLPWNLVATSTMQIMENTIKSLGDAVRERIPITNAELPKAMRRLIAELERCEAKRDRERDRPQKHKPS
jgi:hypothetical protein